MLSWLVCVYVCVCVCCACYTWQGYLKAGQLGTALSNVKWVTDYFIKCIGNGQRDIVVQVSIAQCAPVPQHPTVNPKHQ
jgi:hypothetical protein